MNTKPYLSVSICTLSSVSMLAADNHPMNVIFILCEDMGYGDLGCYGQEYIKTSNIDRMASEGIQFMQHYAGCPVSALYRPDFIPGIHR